MGERLVDDMTEKWKPEQYKDTYTDDLMARIEKRVKAGETHVVTPVSEEGEPRRGAEVIDLVSMLRRSLEKKGKRCARGCERRSGRRARPKRGAPRASRLRGSCRQENAAQRKPAR